MRDFEGYNKTKHELLRLRPNQRIYWIGLAISYHMLKDFKNALKVLDVYETACQVLNLHATLTTTIINLFN
jgi:peptide alpha-N-acetyltransferase